LVRGARQKDRKRTLGEVVLALRRHRQEQIRWSLGSSDHNNIANELERDADSRLQLFMNDLLPRLNGYLPGA
jgi:hypothetical protein